MNISLNLQIGVVIGLVFFAASGEVVFGRPQQAGSTAKDARNTPDEHSPLSERHNADSTKPPAKDERALWRETASKLESRLADAEQISFTKCLEVMAENGISRPGDPKTNAGTGKLLTVRSDQNSRKFLIGSSLTGGFAIRWPPIEVELSEPSNASDTSVTWNGKGTLHDANFGPTDVTVKLVEFGKPVVKREFTLVREFRGSRIVTRFDDQGNMVSVLRATDSDGKPGFNVQKSCGNGFGLKVVGGKHIKSLGHFMGEPPETPQQAANESDTDFAGRLDRFLADMSLYRNSIAASKYRETPEFKEWIKLLKD